MVRKFKVRVYKESALGVFVWECQVESCRAPEGYVRSGASMHWEVANHAAAEHVANWHHAPKHLCHDMGTPPGGTRIDWTDTGHIEKIVLPSQKQD